MGVSIPGITKTGSGSKNQGRANVFHGYEGVYLIVGSTSLMCCRVLIHLGILLHM